MASITIKDLATSMLLDRQAMSSIRGGGAPWVFGWIRPYVASSPGAGGQVINFYQINNYADQMINQIQIVDVNNTAPNAAINVDLDETSTNLKH
jgi:hypothetical protein